MDGTNIMDFMCFDKSSLGLPHKTVFNQVTDENNRHGDKPKDTETNTHLC